MSKLAELQEKRTKQAAKIREMADAAETRAKEGKPAFDAEQRKAYDEVNADYDATMAAMRSENEAKEVADRRSQLEADDKRSINRGGFDPNGEDRSSGGGDRTDRGGQPHASDRDTVLQGWARAGRDMPLTDEHRAACQRTGVNANAREIIIRLDEPAYRQRRDEFRTRHISQAQSRAMSAGNAVLGGSTVPEGFLSNLEVAMLAYNGLEPWATIILTDNGNDLPMPTANDTGNEGEIVGENTEVDEDDAATGSVVMGAHKFSSKFIKLSSELLADSAFNFAAIAGAMAGERIGRHAEKKFTTGAGTTEPKGLITAATLGKTAASATAIAADELIDLQHSVDPAYRSGPGVAFMMHDSIVKAVRKLKDSNGAYLWQSGLAAGVPDTFLGSNLAINQNMASSIAASAKTVAYGDLSKYTIRRVKEIRLVRVNERFVELDQVAFIMFIRQDGNLLDAGVAPVKYLAQAAS